MIYQGIVVTGTDGAEIASVASELCKNNEKLVSTQIITTKTPASGSAGGEKWAAPTAKEQFDKMSNERKLIVSAQHGDDFYGITKKTVEQELDKEKTPVFVAPPEVVTAVDALTETLPHTFFTVFLDAPDDILDKRIAASGSNPLDYAEQRTKDRKNAFSSTYIIRNTDKKKTVELVLKLWEFRGTGGVLPEKLIKLMIDCGVLLENAETTNATGAAYDLVLGDEYYHNGKVQVLNEKDSFIKMKPGDYALVGSKETANFPKDIAARFGLSVSLFFQGIILSNGPQIDPGFKGRLFCLLFNTSSAEVQLKRGQHYATMEFIKLLEPTTPYKGGHQGKNQISDYLLRDIPSSAIGELRKDVDDLKTERLWVKLIPLFVSLLGVILAILALLHVF
jgi:deoxycytidine triphosphate deaminase